MIFKYASRELRAHPRYTVLFIINIVIGLSGLSVLESFKASIAKKIESSSQSLAGGDLLIGSRIAIPASTLEKAEALIPKPFEKGESEELFTMISFGQTSRLAQIHARSANLPFYGELKIEPPEANTAAGVLVYSEVLLQLGAAVGDMISVGGHLLKVEGIVREDSTAQLGRGSLAPRVYMSRESLLKTGLVQKGSTLYYQKFYKFSDSTNVDDIAKEIRKTIKDSAINVRSHSKVSEGNARMMAYLNDYLGLVTLIALLLSNIGTVYLFRAHIIDRLRDVSVLKMVGLRVRGIAAVYFTEILILAVIGVILSIGVSLFLFPLIKVLSQEILPIEVAVTLDPMAAGLVAIVGILSTLFCVFPLIQKARHSTAAQLFQEGASSEVKLSLGELLLWTPSMLFFFGLAVWQSHSLRVASIFVASILGAAVIASLFGFIGLRILETSKIFKSLEVRYAFRELSRRPAESLTAFVALTIGALLASLVLIIESSIQKEFDISAAGGRPSLFMFDIQEEQVGKLKEIAKELNVPLDNLSPMIRARLDTINGKDDFMNRAENLKTREDEESERSLNRTYNLTERENLSKSEEVEDGRYFLKPYDAGLVPEISIEERFAERLGIEIGDTLGFDILGVPVNGTVVGTRRVKWASFQPNFFVQFQSGVFADTPKVFLGSIPEISEATKSLFQTKVVEALPNISILDVSRTLERMIEMAKQMAWALKLMAALVLFSAIAVVISIQGYHVQRNTSERSLLNLIGLLKSRIRKVETIEAWMLTFVSLSFGWLLSFFVAWPLTYVLFDRTPSFSFTSLLVLLAAAPVIFRGARNSTLDE